MPQASESDSVLRVILPFTSSYLCPSQSRHAVFLLVENFQPFLVFCGHLRDRNLRQGLSTVPSQRTTFYVQLLLRCGIESVSPVPKLCSKLLPNHKLGPIFRASYLDPKSLSPVSFPLGISSFHLYFFSNSILLQTGRRNQFSLASLIGNLCS